MTPEQRAVVQRTNISVPGDPQSYVFGQIGGTVASGVKSFGSSGFLRTRAAIKQRHSPCFDTVARAPSPAARFTAAHRSAGHDASSQPRPR